MSTMPSKRRTMIKERVGMVRVSCYDLPETGFTYGKKIIQDTEGAGEVISTWVSANPTESKAHERNYIRSNVLAIRNGALTSSAQREFAIALKNIRMVDLGTEGEESHRKYLGPFGRITEYTEENAERLIQATYSDFSREDRDYPDLSGFAPHGQGLPEPRDTHASLLQAQHTKAMLAVAGAPPSDAWKMKRFKNVPSRLGTT